MKRKLVKFVGFLSVLLAFASLLAAQSKNAEPESDAASAAELIALEKERSAAIARRDTEFLSRLYADDFRGVTALGFEVNKETLMAVFRRDDASVKFELHDLNVRFYGETAILTGRLVGKSSATGKIVHESKYLHVYLKVGDGWKIVAGQGTMTPSTPRKPRFLKRRKTIRRLFSNSRK